MFARSLNVSSNRSSRKPRPRRTRTLRHESLESRELLTTTYLVLDFTPDYHAGSFIDTFTSTRLPNSPYAPSFLDFNGDHRVNAADAAVAAQRVTNRVKGFFAPIARYFDVRVTSGDLRSNSNWGYQWNNWGRYYSSVEVAVMYLGGTSRDGAGILGMAPQATNGRNFEGYGETYTRAIANWMVKLNPNARPNDFVTAVARTAAHELGHMFGLRHTRANLPGHIMNSSVPMSPVASSFQNRLRATTGGTAQNAFRELWYSFAGQYQQHNQPTINGQFATVDGAGVPVSADGSTAWLTDEALLSLAGDDLGTLTADGAAALAQTASTFGSDRNGLRQSDLAGAAQPDTVQRLSSEAAPLDKDRTPAWGLGGSQGWSERSPRNSSDGRFARNSWRLRPGGDQDSAGAHWRVAGSELRSALPAEEIRDDLGS